MIKVNKTIPSTAQKLVFVSDTHHPYQDKIAVRLTLSFLRWFQPDFVYLIGDIIDFYSLSRYQKDPQKGNMLQREVDETISFLSHVRNACPDATIYYKEGNHEERLISYIKNNKELAGLTALTLPSLLCFDEFGIIHSGYRETMTHHNFLVEHGDIVRKGSAMTARGMFERRHISGISGHTHRMGAHYRSTISGTYHWHENGCLCQLDPEYTVSKPDWQHGFSVGHYLPEFERMIIDQIPILGGTLFYQGMLFEARELGVRRSAA